MTIYVDELLAVNFITDYILLCVTKEILKNKDKIIFVFITAVLMALFSLCVTFLPQISIIAVLVPFILLPLAFKLHSLKLYLRYISVFYGTVFIFGGCALAFVSAFGVYSYKILLVSVFLGTVIFNMACRGVGRSTMKANSIVNITLYKNEHEITIPSIVDTGNSLYDYISNLPVIVADYDSVKTLLSVKIREAFETKNDPVEIFASAPLELRLVHYNTVGTKHGRIVGFKVDKILIDGMETDALIGISPLPVSSDNEYHGLVNPLVCV